MNGNNLNLSNDQMNSLLGAASQKLGTSPEVLKSQLDQGKIEEVVKNLDPKTATKINSMLQNPKALEAMLQNQKVKDMLKGLMGNK